MILFLINDFKERFKSFHGSSYTIDDLNQTIKIKPYPYYNFIAELKRMSWKKILTWGAWIIIFIVSFLLNIAAVILVICFIYLLFKYSKNQWDPQITLIDLANRKFLFTSSGFIKRKRIVPFEEIIHIQFDRQDKQIDAYTNETRLYGHVIRLLQKTSNKKRKLIYYNVLAVRNADDALSLVQWFDAVIGLKMSKRQANSSINAGNYGSGQDISFKKIIPGKDYTPKGFDMNLTDARCYNVFEKGRNTLSIWMNDVTSVAYAHYKEKKYFIKRLAADQKESFGILNFKSFIYQVGNYLTGKEEGKLIISNIRKSWKGYNAKFYVNGEMFTWHFQKYGFGDFGLSNTAMRYNGRFVGKNKSIFFYSRFLYTDKYGQSVNKRRRNQYEIEGYIDAKNGSFNPLLVFVLLYLFEMELTPAREYYYD